MKGAQTKHKKGCTRAPRHPQSTPSSSTSTKAKRKQNWAATPRPSSSSSLLFSFLYTVVSRRRRSPPSSSSPFRPSIGAAPPRGPQNTRRTEEGGERERKRGASHRIARDFGGWVVNRVHAGPKQTDKPTPNQTDTERLLMYLRTAKTTPITHILGQSSSKIVHNNTVHNWQLLHFQLEIKAPMYRIKTKFQKAEFLTFSGRHFGEDITWARCCVIDWLYCQSRSTQSPKLTYLMSKNLSRHPEKVI